MSTYNITVNAGESKRLQTSGKYCDRDIIVTCEGSTNISTCNITITLSYNPGNAVVYYQGLSVESGGRYISSYYQNLEYGKPNYIANVLSGSRIIVSASYAFCINDWRYSACEYFEHSTVAMILAPSGTSDCTFDIGEGEGGGINVILPTRTVTVIDNDCAGDIVITALVNEGGKLIYKSTNMPSSGSATITYAWYTPIFITSKYAAYVSVYDAEGDLIRYCPNNYDATNKTFAVFPQSDGGDNHEVYVFQ